MNHPLGVAGGAGGKVQHHGVVGQGGLPLQSLRSLVHGCREIGKAGHVLLDRPQLAGQAHLLHCGPHPVGHLVLGSADDSLHLGLAQPVADVRLGEHVGHGDHHRPQLVEGNGHQPVLIVALEGHHHLVPPADALRQQGVGHLAAQAADVSKGKRAFRSLGVAPDQSPLAGVLGSQGVHHVVAEVKVLRVVQPEAGEPALAVHRLPAEGFIDHAWFPHSVGQDVFGRPKARNRA